jgi:hypothetical protein
MREYLLAFTFINVAMTIASVVRMATGMKPPSPVKFFSTWAGLYVIAAICVAVIR